MGAGVQGKGRVVAGGEVRAEVPGKGGKGRVVLNHSTHIPGLIEVLQRLVEMDGEVCV